MLQYMIYGSALLVVILCLAFNATYADPAGVEQSAAEYTALSIPAHEFLSYTDANGIYTVIGNVKNGYGHAVSPIITLAVQDKSGVLHYTIHHNAIAPGGELPFMVKMPDIYDNATLLEPKVYGVTYNGKVPEIRVVYDQTLVVHSDGHLTGYVINAGDSVAVNPTVWAVVHGSDGALDVTRNAEPFGEIAPGQTVAFSMYPDPTVSDMVLYYSCFAPSDDSVFTIKSSRGEQTYNLRYESGAWLYRPVFSDDGTEVTIQSTNSYPFETYANLEVPPVTRTETFEVYLDGETVESIQSIDEMGMWHLAFDIPKHSQPVITVRGFEEGPLLPALVPGYVRDTAALWAAGLETDDILLTDLRLLADSSLIEYGYEGDPLLPRWLAPLMEWYGAGILSDDEFLMSISYMTQNGLVRLG